MNLNKRFHIAKILGLDIYIRVSAFVGLGILWLILFLIANTWLGLSFITAIFIALLAALLHFDLEFFHQLSHAVAARKVGYPMEALTFFWVLAVSHYPRDEPELPAETHITRAIGGPIGSLLLSILFALIVFVLTPLQNLVYLIFLFLFLDNFIIFTLGPLLPVRFLDGGTILYWWDKRGKS